MKASLLVAFLGALLVPAPETFSPDADGFIRNWLVLAPIAVQEDSGASEIDKDTESADVTLAKGQNVLVFKVINEKNNWQGCARFTKDGAPVKNIKISLTPQ